MSNRSPAGLRRQLLAMSAGAAVLCLVAGLLAGWLLGAQRGTGPAGWQGLWPLLALLALAAAINQASGALARQVDDLRAVHARLQTLLGAVPDAILGLDEQLNIVMANPAVASVFGIETHEAIGRSLTQLLPACSAGWARSQLGAPVAYANPAFAQLTGYSRDEIVGARPRAVRWPTAARAWTPSSGSAQTASCCSTATAGWPTATRPSPR